MFRNYCLSQSCLVGASVLFLTGCIGPKRGADSTMAPEAIPQVNVAEGERLMPLTNLPEEPELADFLRVAALNNPGVEAAFYEWKAALEMVPQVRALPDPRFTYGYFVEQVETRVGPQRQRFGIAQSFPWIGTLRLRESQAGHAALAAQQRYQQAKLALFYAVKEAYFELAYLRQAIRLTEENIELLKHLENVAQAKVRTGGAASAVGKAQVELGQLENQLLTLRELRQPINAKLNASLNRETGLPIPWPAPMSVATIRLDEEALLRRLSKDNPELLSLAAAAKESDLSVHLARKAFYPDLTLGVDYVETDDIGAPGVVGSGRDPVMVMGSFNLPLWWGKQKAALRSAQATRIAATKNLENRTNDLVAEIKLVLFRYRDAARKISLFADTLMPLAKNSLDVAEQAYQAGRADFLQLIDAQRLLLDIQLSYYRAIADREQRLAQIEMMVGGSPHAEIAPATEKNHSS